MNTMKSIFNKLARLLTMTCAWGGTVAFTAAHAVNDLPGGPAVMRWFGRVHSFHDAEILSLTLNRRGESLLRLHAWLLLSGQGPEARLELAKPAVVTFILKEIMDLRLEGFSPQKVRH